MPGSDPGEISQIRLREVSGIASTRSRLELPALFLVGVGLMHFAYGGWVSLYSTALGVPGNDSYYHVKMAAMLPEIGLVREFPWLKFCYFTKEGQAFVSHHVGFHVFLAPFVYVSHWLTGDYLTGARWAMAVCLGFVLVFLDLILIAERVRWRGLWLLLLLFLPGQFFTRQAYVRAICPSLVFMLLIVWSMLRQRPWLTAPGIAGYVHLYLGGVVYAPLLVGLYVLGHLIGPRGERAIPWKLLLWSLGGWFVGVLTYPYVGGMWEFLRLQVFGSGLTPDIAVGQEWKPYEGVWWFAQQTGLLLIAWAGVAMARLRVGPLLNARELFLLLVNLAFFVLTLKARRFIEYWPVFCWLSAAVMSAPFLQKLAEWFDRATEAPEPKEKCRWLGIPLPGVLASAGLTGVAIAAAWQPWLAIQRSARCKYDLPAIRGAMDYLQAHSQPGDVVFTDDWDIFPLYFYFNTHNHYIVGLDPKFTQARRPDLWARYVVISRGQTPANASYDRWEATAKKTEETLAVRLEDVREHFGARFVITDADHQAFAAKLARAGGLSEIVYPSTTYKDAASAPFQIFRMKD